MTEHLSFILEKPAKNNGGDKYKCEDNESFFIYIPQYISRVSSNEPKKKIRITID